MITVLVTKTLGRDEHRSEEHYTSRSDALKDIQDKVCEFIAFGYKVKVEPGSGGRLPIVHFRKGVDSRGVMYESICSASCYRHDRTG